MHILWQKNCCQFTGVSRWLERDTTIIITTQANLHICTEMAFGFMVKRWSILQRPIIIANCNIEHLICSIGVLHNYCINEQLFIAVEMVFLSQKTLTFLQKRQYCKTLLPNLMEKIWCITLQLTLLLLFVWSLSLSCGCCWNKRDSTEVDGLSLTYPATTKMQLSTTAAPKSYHAKFMLGPATIVGSPLLLLLLFWGGAVSIISTDDKSWLSMALLPPKMTM